MKKMYNKLVRDKIIDIIQSKGQKAIHHAATAKEYKSALYKKLDEEVQEFLGETSREEIADILEVIHAICDLNSWTLEEVENIRMHKQQERGAFRDMIILESVEDS